jgi:hypothetical protein
LAWATPMAAKSTGTAGYFYGGGASPALHEGRIYIVNDNEEESFAAAFDTRTGAELWRAARDERSNWSTPYVWQNDLRTEVVTVGSNKVRSYDVNGKLLWELGVGTTLHTPTVGAGRAPLCELRLLQRSETAGVRHPARRVGRHFLERRGNGQQLHRLVTTNGLGDLSVASGGRR